MKTLQKCLALLLTLIMVLSLSACGSLEAAKAVRNIQKLDSYRADCDIDMSMSMGMLGESIMDLELSMGGGADVNRDPLKGAGEFKMELLDEAVEGQFYFAKEEEETRGKAIEKKMQVGREKNRKEGCLEATQFAIQIGPIFRQCAQAG